MNNSKHSLQVWCKDYIAFGATTQDVSNLLQRLRLLFKTEDRISFFLKYCRVCKNPVVKNVATLQDKKILDCRVCSLCTTCCKCEACPGCRSICKTSQLCSVCNLCLDGCDECIRCTNCSVVCSTNDHCTHCETCGDCCQCKVNFIQNPIKFHNASKLQFKNNKSKRHLAVEIEVSDLNVDEQALLFSTVNKWNGSIVYDGSIPNGCEINTSPANGDVFSDQIFDICNALNSLSPTVDVTCGLHVHIDARDFNYYDIVKLVKVYSKIEDALFQLVPPSRRQSKYAIKCSNIYSNMLKGGRIPYKQVKNRVIGSIYNSYSTQGHKTNKYSASRYNALNIHSWFYRGTVECRLFNGTTNPIKIINWAQTWASILDYANRIEKEDIDKILIHEPLENLYLILAGQPKLIEFCQERYLKFKKELEISKSQTYQPIESEEIIEPVQSIEVVDTVRQKTNFIGRVFSRIASFFRRRYRT